MVVRSLAMLEQRELVVFGRFEGNCIASSYPNRQHTSNSPVSFLCISNAPWRSPQKLEYSSFSAASSRMTTNRFPALLRPWTNAKKQTRR